MTKQLFGQEKLERIFLGAIRVLSEMGLRVQNRRCLEILERFGAKIDYPKMRAIMPEDCINRMLAIVRKDQKGWQDSRPQLPFGMGVGAGGTCPLYFDDEEGKARRANERDCIEAYKVIETSPVASSGPPVSNCDSPLNLTKIVADLALAKAPFKNTYTVVAMPIAGQGSPITPAGTLREVNAFGWSGSLWQSFRSRGNT